jgi:Domain of unknown function (DUF4251)
MNYLMSLISFLLIANFVSAQDKASESADFKALVDNKSFVFAAQSANPMRGRTIHLSPGYTMEVSADTVTASLPYYGRAYSAPMNPSDTGIKFTSSEFTYTVKDRKKNGWDVAIKAKDGIRSHQIYLTISSNGAASARVLSSDKESISFDGYIQKTP